MVTPARTNKMHKRDFIPKFLSRQNNDSAKGSPKTISMPVRLSSSAFVQFL